MGLLRRLLGGGSQEALDAAPQDSPRDSPSGPAMIEAEERDREVQVLRDEQDRLDELARRQLRYADHAWQPPAQGGDRRADDADEGAEPG